MRKKGGLVQPYRDITALAGAQVLCFLVLAELESHFVIIHLYECILYLAILVMLWALGRAFS